MESIVPWRASDFLCGCRVDGVLPSWIANALPAMCGAGATLSMSDGAVASAVLRGLDESAAGNGLPWLAQQRQLLDSSRGGLLAC